MTMKIDKQKFKQVAQSARAKLGVAMVAVSTAPMAFAQDTSIGTTVKTLVEGYKDEALIALMAMIVVYWTLKATGVLKPR